MSAAAMTPERLLQELIVLPAREWAAGFRARAQGVEAERLRELAAAVEQLAVSEIAQAQAGGALVVALAEQFGPAERVCALRAAGQALAYGGKFADALASFDGAIELAEAAGLRLEAAQARMSSIHPLTALGQVERIDAAGAAARATFLALGEQRLAARTDANLGSAALNLGRPEAALRHFDRALDVLAGDAVAAAQLQSNRGRALQQLDRHDDARTAFERALQVFVAQDLHWAAAIVEGNLAELCVRQGRIQDALVHLERTRRHLEHDDAPSELARVMRDHAETLLSASLPAEAARHFRDALAELERSGQTAELPRSLLGLGEACLQLGELDEAAEALERADCLLAASDGEVLRSQVLLLRAELALAREDFPRAEEHACAAIAHSAARPVSAALGHALRARIAQERGDYAGAAAALAPAFPLSAALDIAPLRSEIFHRRGALHRALGRRQEALEDLRVAVDLIERVRGTLAAQRIRSAFQGTRVGAYAELAGAALDCGDAALAFETVERARSRALLDLTRQTADPIELARVGADPHRAAIAERLSARRAALDLVYGRMSAAAHAGAELAADRTAVRSLEAEVAELESRLAHLVGCDAALGRPRGVTEIRESLADDAALVEYFGIDGYLAGFVLTRTGLHVVPRLVHLAVLEDAIKRTAFQLRRGLRSAEPGPRSERLTADVRRELAALSEMVFAPLAGMVEACRSLCVVPFGAMHGVPLHALRHNDAYLIERFTISYAPSASLATNGARRPPHGRATRSAVVGVADEFAPRIEEECRRVAPILGADRVVLGDAATVARVKDLVRDADLVHIGCHGRYAAETPMASGIRLADRWLSVREIHELQMAAQLVVLSGCETGRAHVEVGDELIGLIRPFLAAGVRNLLVSLWTVGDAGTEELMIRFYERAAEGDYSRALRAAQLDLMKTRPHPASWAPFILVGGI